jgi:hypothetical protein
VVLIVTEAACNYFAVETLMEGKGLFWLILRIFVAVGITGGCLYLFEKWLGIIINKPAYKQTEPTKRSLVELIVLTCICIGIESAFYWLCKRRGIALEGGSGDETANNFLIIFGMLLPVFVGYLAYERSRFVAPYYNTVRIAKAEKAKAKMETTIATNNQYMEDHFKSAAEDAWGVVDEFKIYKQNYDEKRGLSAESLTGHFCETHDHFECEAMTRYKKDVLNLTPVQPLIVMTNEPATGSNNNLLKHAY